MMRLSTFTTITLFAGALAFTGATSADELENPGAETGDLTGWTDDDGVTASESTDIFSPLSGDWFFLMGEDVPLGEHSESMQQAVDVAGCSNEFVSGEFTASGSVASDGDHWGTFLLDFGEGSIVMLDLLQSETAGEWTDFGPVTGLIPDVDIAEYQVVGSKSDPDEVETAIQVAYEELELTFNCVTDFAKVSGRIGEDPQGRGRSPEWTFAGAVGTLEDETFAASTIEINYRAFDSACTFTANEIEFIGEDSATINADYECVSGELDGQTGVATIDLTAKGASGCTAHANRDRGSIAVTADDAALDVSGEFGGTGVEACIDRGNVDLDAGEEAEEENGEDTA